MFFPLLQNLTEDVGPDTHSTGNNLICGPFSQPLYKPYVFTNYLQGLKHPNKTTDQVCVCLLLPACCSKAMPPRKKRRPTAGDDLSAKKSRQDKYTSQLHRFLLICLLTDSPGPQCVRRHSTYSIHLSGIAVDQSANEQITL